MFRRDVIATAGLAAMALASKVALADDHEHMHHDHGAMGNTKLVESASTCIKAGDTCIAHCLQSFAAGDTSLAACAKSVNEMLSICSSLQKLASLGSAHLAEMSKLALSICLECEKECRKHEQQHDTCKACADACSACADECRKAA